MPFIKGHKRKIKLYPNWMKPMREAYNNSKLCARRRDIGFHILFEDWCLWWENQLGFNWINRRGQGANKYQMGRIGDRGDYRIDNVKCITHSQNAMESMLGRKHSSEARAKMKIAWKRRKRKQR